MRHFKTEHFGLIRTSSGEAGTAWHPSVSLLWASKDPIPTTDGGHGGQLDPGGYQDGDDEEQDKSPGCFFFAIFRMACRDRCSDGYGLQPSTLDSNASPVALTHETCSRAEGYRPDF